MKRTREDNAVRALTWWAVIVASLVFWGTLLVVVAGCVFAGWSFTRGAFAVLGASGAVVVIGLACSWMIRAMDAVAEKRRREFWDAMPEVLAHPKGIERFMNERNERKDGAA